MYEKKKRKETAITILIFVTKERASLSSCSSGELKPKKIYIDKTNHDAEAFKLYL